MPHFFDYCICVQTPSILAKESTPGCAEPAKEPDIVVIMPVQVMPGIAARGLHSEILIDRPDLAIAALASSSLGASTGDGCCAASFSRTISRSSSAVRPVRTWSLIAYPPAVPARRAMAAAITAVSGRLAIGDSIPLDAQSLENSNRIGLAI